MERKLVTATQLKEIVNSCDTRQTLWHMKYRRATPKCTSCGRKSSAWLKTKPAICPHCGGLIAYEGDVDCYISNGIGEEGNFYYFADRHMKQCILRNVVSLEHNGLEFYLV